MAKKLRSAADFFPNKKTLPALRLASKTCEGCHLYKYATQTVFGEGPAKAPLMVIGEIPGDKEDITGKPFRGPAGIFLRNTFKEVGLVEEDIYFTNVVKHFKFELTKNKRMHRSPIGSEIRACSPWLEAEIAVVQPQLILCLGSIAAKKMVGNNFQVRKDRGKWIKQAETYQLLITFHPSAILRAYDDKSRHEMKAIFKQDLRKVYIALNKI